MRARWSTIGIALAVLIAAACQAPVELDVATDGAGAAAAPRVEPDLQPSECPGWQSSDRLACFELEVPELHGDADDGDVVVVPVVVYLDEAGATPTFTGRDDIVLVVGGVIDAAPDDTDDDPRPLSLPESLAEHQVVQMLPRGSHWSTPNVQCPELDELLSVELVEGCVERLVRAGIDPAAFGPDDVAADIAILRAELDIDAWPVVISPGLGQSSFAVAGSLVDIDAAAVNSLIIRAPHLWGDATLEGTTGVALDRMVATCADQPACARAFPRLDPQRRAFDEVSLDDPVADVEVPALRWLGGRSLDLDTIALWPEIVSRTADDDFAILWSLFEPFGPSSTLDLVAKACRYDALREEDRAACAHGVVTELVDDMAVVDGTQSGTPPVLVTTVHSWLGSSRADRERYAAANPGLQWVDTAEFVFGHTPCARTIERAFLSDPERFDVVARQVGCPEPLEWTVLGDPPSNALGPVSESLGEITVTVDVPTGWSGDEWIAQWRGWHRFDAAEIWIETWGAGDQGVADWVVDEYYYGEWSDDGTPTDVVVEEWARSGRTWTVQSFDDGYGTVMFVAAAMLQGNEVVVVLRSPSGEADALREQVLLPALDSISVS